jgi:hypothetical protein
LNEIGGRHDSSQVIGGNFEDGDPPISEVLLVADILIAGDEQVEFQLRLSNQVSILDRVPTALLGGGARVPEQQLVHRPRDALVQKDSHAVANRADSERSNTPTAISRVTVGKHSRNSSSV